MLQLPNNNFQKMIHYISSQLSLSSPPKLVELAIIDFLWGTLLLLNDKNLKTGFVGHQRQFCQNQFKAFFRISQNKR